MTDFAELRGPGLLLEWGALTIKMLNAISLMLLTGLLWAGVGVLFGAAPSEKDRLYAFFSLNGLLFLAFVWLSQPPAAAPAREVLVGLAL